MLQGLLTLLFQNVMGMFQGILSPFINVIVALFPSISPQVSYVLAWFNLAFTFLTTTYRWLLFTPAMFLMLFDYFVIKYTIWGIACTTRFGLKMYNAFKL